MRVRGLQTVQRYLDAHITCCTLHTCATAEPRHLRGCHIAPPVGLGGVAAAGLPPKPKPPTTGCCLQRASVRHDPTRHQLSMQIFERSIQSKQQLTHPKAPKPPPPPPPPPGACCPKPPKPLPCCTAAPCPNTGCGAAAAPKPLAWPNTDCGAAGEAKPLGWPKTDCGAAEPRAGGCPNAD